MLCTLIASLHFANAQKTSPVRLPTRAAPPPLAGVNVVEKGTTNGATTDFNGKYEIEVSGNYE
ncbi:carboxypeptidase-like regulatory domain-containing protein [Sinomicrobium kalidii]|uniref:carboxypeptidase-like regulatory domain-containing protein n=1 Tax=Sinomicrobium kalidii TaxID=2900738 RepID=UPI001E61B996|nr:carboxypeptidase-like regulatory domain-containing protein [Sinomicrobium kalidii]UGU15619.1 carboxypeptidase-like regulatory domain-containing protein [Sinomicrobium kalidii]